MDLARLMMFDAEVYVRLFRSYNEAIWPAPLISIVLILFVFNLVIRPRPGGDRAISVVLGGFWIWTGWVFHFQTFATINIAAPVFGAMFLIQGGALIWSGVIRGGLQFNADRLVHCGRDLGLALMALVCAPFVAVATGGSWLDAPLAGLTPDATLVLSLGLLGLTVGRIPRWLLVIPALWCVIATMMAWLAAVPVFWVMPVVAWIGLIQRWRV